MSSRILAAAPMPARALLLAQALTMLARRLWKLPTALAHRDQLRMLAGSDDHLLADIGVTRDDIERALSGPFWRDPSVELLHRLRLRSSELRSTR